MIIRLFLKLFLAALVVLIIADVFYELHLGSIATLVIQLGDDVLLLSFALLLISGTIFFAKQIGETIKNYFSAQQRAQRKLFFSMARHNYLQRLFASKKQQLFYFARLKTASLLAKNNKQHCSLLAKAILKELQLIKNKLPETQFKQYSQAIKQAAAQQQMQRLLELQHEISTTDFL
jgi:hypothetical protein